ncbi:LysR substrate-binding domain-containing protein [Sphingobium sp.]|uniref:LysR substrate-binding domain-containing protein n=1 Tax=Sphingobium sp. TaxID=1912891 RepID=UPI0028BE9E53|nr:LysR substrate-binding domain-containing protein [Sphingobium sp.]
MDQTLFQSFVILAEELHFGRAAERLGISQPPLSGRIRQLEELVGTRLFERTSRRVTLTDAGTALLEQARDILSRTEAAIAHSRRVGNGEVGEIRLAMTTSVPLLPLGPAIIGDFRASHPDVRIMIEEWHSARQLEAVGTGLLHAAFMRLPGDRPPQDPAIAALPLDREELRLFLRTDDPLVRAAAGRPVALRDLAGRDFVMFDRSSRLTVPEEVRALCRAAGFEPRISIEARESLVLCGMISAGAGVAILPASFRHIGVAGVTTLPLTEPTPFLTTWLAYPAAPRSPLTRRFVASARRTMAGSTGAGSGSHAPLPPLGSP